MRPAPVAPPAAPPAEEDVTMEERPQEIEPRKRTREEIRYQMLEALQNPDRAGRHRPRADERLAPAPTETQDVSDGVGGASSSGAAAAGGDSGRRYMSIPRTDEPTLREMTSAPARPLDKALVQELVDWCGNMECGHTRFLNLHRDCGADAVLGPDTLAKRIKTCWDPENKYELIFAQIVRTPAARRLAKP